MPATLTGPTTHGTAGKPYASALVASGVTPPLRFSVVSPAPPLPAYLDSFAAYYGVDGAADALPVDIVVPAVALGSVLGIVWVTADTGAGPSLPTDPYNTWVQMPGGYFTNSGYSTLFVCPNMTPGAYTVTVNGLVPGTPPSNAPVATVLLYSLPIGSGVQALQAALACNGVLTSWYLGPTLTLQAKYSASYGGWHSLLIACINTTPEDSSGIARTWSIESVPVGAVASVRLQYEDTGTLETGAVADSLVDSDVDNFIAFLPTPTPAPQPPYPAPIVSIATAMVGLLVSTPA